MQIDKIDAKYVTVELVNATNVVRIHFHTPRYGTISVTRLGNFLHFGQLLKPLTAINLSKSLTFLGNFCKGVKFYYFASEIIFGQLL